MSDLTVNVGVDLEDVDRFQAMPRRTAEGLFTGEELAYSAGADRPAVRLAGTWCAKEAVVKALWPWVRLDPRRVTVTRLPDGQPQVSVSGWDAAGAGVSLRVSIAHTATAATASAVVWGPAPVPAEPGPAVEEGGRR